MRPPTSPTDEGFTLVELLVVSMITALVAVVIAAAFAAGAHTTDVANARLSASRAGPVISSYFPADVQSSATISVAASPCTTATPTVATLTWVDVDSAGTSTSRSALYTCQTSGTTKDLVRSFTSGATTTSTVVVYDVAAASVACAPDCTSPTSATISLTSGDFTFAVAARRRAA